MLPSYGLFFAAPGSENVARPSDPGLVLHHFHLHRITPGGYIESIYIPSGRISIFPLRIHAQPFRETLYQVSFQSSI
ncbi:hypothetical protein CC2G_011051 [Coprinopsis cinerea AmutBmut pab1-1]|nr:hypothetical protein CC2G_011051 [Coprinopsis cinerea AmutBmut pab1-1]